MGHRHPTISLQCGAPFILGRILKCLVSLNGRPREPGQLFCSAPQKARQGSHQWPLPPCQGLCRCMSNERRGPKMAGERPARGQADRGSQGTGKQGRAIIDGPGACGTTRPFSRSLPSHGSQGQTTGMEWLKVWWHGPQMFKKHPRCHVLCSRGGKKNPLPTFHFSSHNRLLCPPPYCTN
jgi:hypothetical protein